jgi:hypothetical protein
VLPTSRFSPLGAGAPPRLVDREPEGEHGLREIPVVGEDGRIVGFLDEAEITRVYHDATQTRRPDA